MGLDSQSFGLDRLQLGQNIGTAKDPVIQILNGSMQAPDVSKGKEYRVFSRLLIMIQLDPNAQL